MMGRGYAWLDTGNHDYLLEASGYIATVERRQGHKAACPGEVAYRQCWNDSEQLAKLGAPLTKNGYGQYLQRVLRDAIF